MPRNTLADLNNHLFEQLERLNDEELSNTELENEIKRSKAMCNIANAITNNANTVIQGQKLILEYGMQDTTVQSLLENKDA
jgi:cell shape-determining protein MreC